MKKQQKSQKKHLFARTCRVLGRFLLALGAILCIASAIFAAAPIINPDSVKKDDSVEVVDDQKLQVYPTSPRKAKANNSAAYILPSVIVVTIALFLLGVTFRHYNRTIRNAIARIAKSARLSISTTELVLTTVIWAIVNLIMFFNAPLFSILTFAAMIINNLLFIFAWTSYGCPVYTV